MTTIRLIEAESAPLLARPYYEDGDPGAIVAALAHVPELLEVTAPFVGVALGASAVDARTKELVILRTSARLECRFCVRTHSLVALDAGLSRPEVLALRAGDDPDGVFGEARERALLPWVDAVATGTGPVEAALTAALREHFDDHEVVELALLVGATMMLNRFCTALDLPVPDAALRHLATEGLE